MARFAGYLHEMRRHECGRCGTTQNLWWVRDLQLCLCHDCNGVYKKVIRAVRAERLEQKRYVATLARDITGELTALPEGVQHVA